MLKILLVCLFVINTSVLFSKTLSVSNKYSNLIKVRKKIRSAGVYSIYKLFAKNPWLKTKIKKIVRKLVRLKKGKVTAREVLEKLGYMAATDVIKDILKEYISDLIDSYNEEAEDDEPVEVEIEVEAYPMHESQIDNLESNGYEKCLERLKNNNNGGLGCLPPPPNLSQEDLEY